MDDSEIKWLLGALAVLALVAGGWYVSTRLETGDSAPPAPVPAAVETPSEPRAPLYPLEGPGITEPLEGELVPLPPLDESDQYFALALLDLFGRDLEALLTGDGLIDKSAATIDTMPRGRVPERIRPIGRLPGTFMVTADGPNGPFFLDPANYSRYDSLVAMFASADTAEVVATYRRFYPLFQQAFERLGYPNGYFNDRAVEVIDHLLETPTPEEPVRLARPHVLYEFSDPDLEALSGGQKLLIRMGPANAKRVRSALLEIRANIANGG